MDQYLLPSATKYLADLSESARAKYLKEYSFITWAGGKATFTWKQFLDHVGTRMKSVPAFDTFNLSAAENIEFGSATENARHFTLYSLRHVTGNQNAELAADLPAKIKIAVLSRGSAARLPAPGKRARSPRTGAATGRPASGSAGPVDRYR